MRRVVSFNGKPQATARQRRNDATATNVHAHYPTPSNPKPVVDAKTVSNKATGNDGASFQPSASKDERGSKTDRRGTEKHSPANASHSSQDE